MPYRRKTIENGIIYDGHIPFAKQADSGKIPVVNAKGEWELQEAPSGSGFLVTVTQSQGTWTADKTLAEIIAAAASGIVPVLKADYGEGSAYYSLSSCAEGGASFYDTNIDSGAIYTEGFDISSDGTVNEVYEEYPSEG